MKAIELRIGNWINYKGDPIKVTMIGEYGIQTNDDDRTINAKFATPDLSPIPLTRNAFENIKDELPPGYELRWNGVKFSLWYNTYEDTNDLNLDVLWIHQYQNLYFALTGDELTITP